MLRTILVFVVLLGTVPAHAQLAGEASEPTEPENHWWIPAVVGVMGGFAFVGATVQARTDDQGFGAQRRLAEQCMVDHTSPACARLDAVGFAYLGATASNSICNPVPAMEFGIASECDAVERSDRRYRAYLTASVLSFAVGLGSFVAYLVRDRRLRSSRETAALQPWFAPHPRGPSGGLRLRLTF